MSPFFVVFGMLMLAAVCSIFGIIFMVQLVYTTERSRMICTFGFWTELFRAYWEMLKTFSVGTNSIVSITSVFMMAALVFITNGFGYIRLVRSQTVFVDRTVGTSQLVMNDTGYIWAHQVSTAIPISYGKRVMHVSHVFHPVTTNPKVRTFSTLLEVEALGTPGEAVRFPDYQYPNRIEPVVQSAMFEFEERYSKELATLYNPLSEEQQRTFAELALPFFREELSKKGIRLRSVRFDLLS